MSTSSSSSSSSTPSVTSPPPSLINSVFSPTIFAGQIALVTGGGTGIGYRTALELIHCGAHVIIASRKKEVIEQAVHKLNAYAQYHWKPTSASSTRPQAHGFTVDIRSLTSINELLEQIHQLYGRLDLLVNNGGGQFPSLAQNFTEKGWNAVIQTNLTGTFFMMQRCFLLFFQKQKSGSIVNVIANMWNGFPMMAHTGAARSAVENLTKSLAIEWATYGVRINAIAPGVIASSGLNNYSQDIQLMISDNKRNNYTYRLGTEEECSAAIVFLLSKASNFTTGVTIRIDGAESLYAPNVRPSKHNFIPPFADEHTTQFVPKLKTDNEKDQKTTTGQEKPLKSKL